MKNTLSDLNNILFEQLERLNDDELTDEEMEMQLKKTDTIVRVSEQIVKNGELAQKAEVAVMTKKGYWSEDPDLTETALYTIRLQQTANRKRRKSNGNDLQRGNTGSNCSQS